VLDRSNSGRHQSSSESRALMSQRSYLSKGGLQVADRTNAQPKAAHQCGEGELARSYLSRLSSCFIFCRCLLGLGYSVLLLAAVKHSGCISCSY
jgi:hypothetical protein